MNLMRTENGCPDFYPDSRFFRNFSRSEAI